MKFVIDTRKCVSTLHRKPEKCLECPFSSVRYERGASGMPDAFIKCNLTLRKATMETRDFLMEMCPIIEIEK